MTREESHNRTSRVPAWVSENFVKKAILIGALLFTYGSAWGNGYLTGHPGTDREALYALADRAIWSPMAFTFIGVVLLVAGFATMVSSRD